MSGKVLRIFCLSRSHLELNCYIVKLVTSWLWILMCELTIQQFLCLQQSLLECLCTGIEINAVNWFCKQKMHLAKKKKKKNTADRRHWTMWTITSRHKGFHLSSSPDHIQSLRKFLPSISAQVTQGKTIKHNQPTGKCSKWTETIFDQRELVFNCSSWNPYLWCAFEGNESVPQVRLPNVKRTTFFQNSGIFSWRYFRAVIWRGKFVSEPPPPQALTLRSNPSVFFPCLCETNRMVPTRFRSVESNNLRSRPELGLSVLEDLLAFQLIELSHEIFTGGNLTDGYKRTNSWILRATATKKNRWKKLSDLSFSSEWNFLFSLVSSMWNLYMLESQGIFLLATLENGFFRRLFKWKWLNKLYSFRLVVSIDRKQKMQERSGKSSMVLLNVHVLPSFGHTPHNHNTRLVWIWTPSQKRNGKKLTKA